MHRFIPALGEKEPAFSVEEMVIPYEDTLSVARSFSPDAMYSFVKDERRLSGLSPQLSFNHPITRLKNWKIHRNKFT